MRGKRIERRNDLGRRLLAQVAQQGFEAKLGDIARKRRVGVEQCACFDGPATFTQGPSEQQQQLATPTRGGDVAQGQRQARRKVGPALRARRDFECAARTCDAQFGLGQVVNSATTCVTIGDQKGSPRLQHRASALFKLFLH